MINFVIIKVVLATKGTLLLLIYIQARMSSRKKAIFKSNLVTSRATKQAIYTVGLNVNSSKKEKIE